jgi:hypothetical protein
VEIKPPPQLSSTCHLLDGLAKATMTAPPETGVRRYRADWNRIGKPEAPAAIMRKPYPFEDTFRRSSQTPRLRASHTTGTVAHADCRPCDLRVT